ncbi:MAG: cytochrome C [Burkholderiaceae bacterium]|nr:cytochrome C [Burkholderiaceae bacterium]
MFKFPKIAWIIAICLTGASAFAQSNKYPGVGRDATPKEVAAWDIDVRPDFKGLPAGSGSVAKGQDVWEAKCAHCHGIFGESNEVFSPLIGGTTAEDIKTGRVANLTRADFPGRTTLMKVATVSTLWDYINRAMPWTNPKTLTTEEVYAVTGFLLNLAGVVPDNFVLSDKNIADVQKRMPNRNGMTTSHAMWPGKEFGGAAKPDTNNIICMKDCVPEPKVASFLPDFARNAHGNLSEQNRIVGQQKGADTSRPEGSSGKSSVAPAASVGIATAPAKAIEGKADAKAVMALLSKNTCTTCHGIDKKVVGPGFNEIAKKYPGKVDYLAGKIKTGGAGVWGPIPMPAQSIGEADAKIIANWIATGASK